VKSTDINNWYLVLQKLRVWIRDEKDSDHFYRPWLLLIIHSQSLFILNMDLFSQRPTLQELLEKILHRSFNSPAGILKSIPQPEEIYFEDQRLANLMDGLLCIHHIRALYKPNRQIVNPILREFTERMSPKESQIPGLLTVPKVTRKMAASLFEAANFFYNAKPWEIIDDRHILMIQLAYQSAPYYVNVLGAAGMEYGISVYTNWEKVEQFYSIPPDDENINLSGHHLFSFTSAPEISFDDMDATEQFGWPLPAPDIYPTPFYFLKRSFKRPNAEMLHWYEAALRAIPLFLDQRDPSDTPIQIPWKGISRFQIKTSRGIQEVQVRFYHGKMPDIPEISKKNMPFEDSDIPPIDRRLIERDLDQLSIEFEEDTSYHNSPLHQTQEVMYDAWETEDMKKRIKLAKKALKICPDCADAYNLLADEEASTREQAIELYRQGVEAGKRALGDDFFKDPENIGHFWGILETRPYMRSMQGLANLLWEKGETDQAFFYFSELLRLNPGDNQGIRFTLLEFFFDTGRVNEIPKLLDNYSDSSNVDWCYTRLLLELGEHGGSRHAMNLLTKALDSNLYVPDLLTGKKKIPCIDHTYITIGGKDEAEDYARRFIRFWRRTTGALDWLAENT